ncbi:MAG: hypothetical protein PHQ19_05800 [Candidatus Krumholzibacteria bacterium]|nr:hypothetical protein [Candidatus Krumholzibacteria bacterium]
MKRTVVVLAIVAALSAATVSTVSAMPVAGERASAVSQWLSYYIANFLRAHAHGVVDLQGIDTGVDERLGGDADDYANGRDEKLGPDADNKRTTGLTGGSWDQFGSGSRYQSFMQ